MNRLLQLAAEGKWADLSKALGRPANLSSCAELAPILESWGDVSRDKDWLPQALNEYSAAFLCCMVQLYGSLDAKQRTAFAESYTRLNEKLLETRRLLDLEIANDENGPLTWTTGTKRVIHLGLQSRDIEANSLLQRLGNLSGHSNGDITGFAEQLESAADSMTPPNSNRVIWFYETALHQLKNVDHADATRRIAMKLAALHAPPSGEPSTAMPSAPPPEPEAGESLIDEIAELARNLEVGAWTKRLRDLSVRPLQPSIGRRFESLGDEARGRQEWFPAAEYYHVAATAFYEAKIESSTIAHKLREMSWAIIEDRLANPIGARDDSDTTDFLSWEQGIDRVEYLVLSHRFVDANRLLSRLKRGPFGHRAQESPGRLEMAGDYLAEKNPELARWFYQELRDWMSRLPVDCLAQKYQVEALVAQASDKLASTERRLQEMSGDAGGSRANLKTRQR